MKSLYGLLKPAYRRCLPEPWRRRLASDRPHPLSGVTAPLRGWLERGARHDEVYDAEFFARQVEPASAGCAQALARSIARAFAPHTVIDVGCGTGALLAALETHGVEGIGFEKAAAAIALARARGASVVELDLERELPVLPHRADLAISLEVAEHLPEARAEGFVELLCRVSDRVLMTAAVPGQGGRDHVNEQPHGYWIGKFEQRGFDFDRELSQELRDEWRGAGAADFYWRNAMAFSRWPRRVP